MTAQDLAQQSRCSLSLSSFHLHHLGPKMSDQAQVLWLLFFIGLAILAISKLFQFLNNLSKSQLQAKHTSVLQRYRRQVIQAATDLDQHLISLCDNDLISMRSTTKDGRDAYLESLSVYTSYLIAQFFSWTWILDQYGLTYLGDVPDTCLRVPKAEKEAIRDVCDCFSTNQYGKAEECFVLWAVEQQGIAQMMTVTEPDLVFEPLGEGTKRINIHRCMGYMPFKQHWQTARSDKPQQSDGEKTSFASMAQNAPVTNEVFRAAFRTIEDGMRMLATYGNGTAGDGRLRRVQHALANLLETTRERDGAVDTDDRTEKRPRVTRPSE